MEPEKESIDLDFRESQPAVTHAMRKRVAKAWANAEQDRDREELDEKESA
jgi:hypothetical protein